MFPEGALRAPSFVDPKAALRKPIHKLGSPVRAKASFIFCLFLLATLAAHSSDIPSQAVTTTELAAWLTGGVSSSRLK
ncbi:MAG: hypothetical protein WA485_16475, partial [Candidatus Sulfotelmatobacter sp.]